jgi:hypothetical protein
MLAQGITGIVRDANTSQPLAGVLVSVLDVVGGRVRGVLTDADGRFVIEVPMGRYRLRSERIGLRPETSEPFDLNTFNLRVEQIVMTIRAVEIAGLVVDTRIKSCRIDPDAALRIQRWWEEIKTALAVSSVLQRQRFATFKIEKFEREWSDDLTRVVDCISRVELSQSSRPFLSAGADFLSEGGFVQGDIDSQRQYYAPDADVLLSDVFLSEHCFSLVEDSDRDDQLGLHFEPVEMRTVPEILGTLWVDTTTAELQNLDFRYTNLDGVGQGEAGGLVAFEYLPSGAWIVSEWYIHMPRVGVRIESRRNDEVPDYLLLGFVDVGGEVTPLVISDEVEEGGPVGAIRGVVFDSIGGGGLVDAAVTIVGIGRQATTDAAGEFILINVPIGPHNLTFFSADTDAWGLGSSLIEVEVKESFTAEARLAIPRFRQVALGLCLGEGRGAQTVVVGHILGPDRLGLSNVALELSWTPQDGADRSVSAQTASDGYFVVCTIPGEVELTVRAEVDGRWIDAFEVVPRLHMITYREVWFTR